jgi:lysophospholipase L1-like esterase
MNLFSVAAISIVLIGDSHSDFFSNSRGSFGFFGQRITEEYPGISLYAVSSSSPAWWVGVNRRITKYGSTFYVKGNVSGGVRNSTPSAASLPSADLLVIEQGSNMVGAPESSVKAMVVDLLSSVKGKYKAYLWVGPPPARDKSTEADVVILDGYLNKYIPSSSYFSSLGLKPESWDKDGVHLTMKPAGRWAEDVAQRIKGMSGS